MTFRFGFYGSHDNLLQNYIPDANECESQVEVCEPNTNCVNLNGGYICSCKPGYLSNGEDMCERRYYKGTLLVLSFIKIVFCCKYQWNPSVDVYLHVYSSSYLISKTECSHKLDKLR